MGNAILAPNLRWYVVTACGTPAVNGYILTFDNNTGLPRATYADPAKLTPNPLRLNLGTDGAYGGPLYWDLDPGLYFIEVYDGSGTLLETQYNYPTVNPGTGGNVINITTNAVNYVPNPQMYFWNDGTSFDNTTLPIGTTPTADEWSFTRTNLDATVTISQEFFAAGVNLAPGTPPCYMRYQVTTPAADTENDWGFTITDVQSLNNLQATAYFWGASLVLLQSIQISLVCVQYFGVGGSPTVTTVLDTYTLSDTFAPFSTTFTVPSISGLTIGAGSYLGFYWRFNPAVSQIAGVTDFRLQQGAGTGPVWPYETLDEQYAKILAFELLGTSDTQGANIVTFSSAAPGQTITVKEAIINTNVETANLLYCSYMPTNPYQFGRIIDSTTIVKNNDGQYIADGVILQSDGNNIVSKTGGSLGFQLDLTIVTPGKKFGIAQISDSVQTQRFWLTNQLSPIVSAFTRDYVTTSASPILKIALLGWNGAVDEPLKQLVSSWNPSGTNPTLSAGWNYIAVSPNLTLLSIPDNPFVLEGIDLTTTYPNAALFIWVDSEDMLIGDSLTHIEWGVNQGYTAFQPYRPTVDESLSAAEHYLYKTYDNDNPLAWGYKNDQLSIEIYNQILLGAEAMPPFEYTYFPLPSQTFISSTFDFDIATPNSKCQISFQQKMFRSPDITFYNPSINYPTVDNTHAHWYVDFGGTSAPVTISGGFEIPLSIIISDSNRVTFEILFNAYRFNVLNFDNVIVENAGVFLNIVADATIGV